MNIPIIESERLRLREWREEDLQPYAEICADAEIMQFVTGKPMSKQEAWRHAAYIIGHWQLRGYGHWAVERKDTEEFIGRLGFFNPVDWPGFEIGWTIARPHWRRGFAEEGARRALEYAFHDMGREEVISVINPGNAPSIALAEKLGERYLRDEELFGEPVCIYGMDKARWQAAR